MKLARAIFAGPSAHRALRAGGVGTIELALGRGGYVRLGFDWLLLTPPSAPFGPLSVSVDGIERLELHPGAPVRVIGEHLALSGQAISLERLRERCPDATRSAPSAAELPAIRAAAAACATELPRPPARLRPGLTELLAGRAADAVRLLAGLGDGLTPAGDDVLCGYAAARAALGAPVALSPAAAGRSCGLALAYLRAAERGELPDVAARLLEAIFGGSASAARAATAPLRSWGSSSGTALAWGISTALVRPTVW